jgi:fatty acid desaturase
VAGFVIYLLFSVSWIPLLGGIALAIFGSSLPLVAKIALGAPCVVLAGHGFHMLGWFAHDGVHLSLLKNKYASFLVGIFAASAALFPLLGYGITHWNHHRFTNQASDPDTRIYPRYRTFWSRFFKGRATAQRGYLRNTLRIALGRPIDEGYRFPFSRGWTRFFAICTLAGMGLWLALYVALAVTRPGAFLTCIAIPWLCAAPMSGLRIYLEHNDTGAGILRDTRSYVSPLWTALMFANNFHLEHHLYPTVPAYRLPKVHRLLRDQGIYERSQSHVVRGFLAPLKYVTGAYAYPGALLADLETDPFEQVST